MPRFDEPLLTRPGAVVCAELGCQVPAQLPLPAMIEADPMPLVTDPIDETLVAVHAPGVKVLENYRRAGWSQAHTGTWLRPSVLERLGAAARSLPERWGLCVFDAWRPLPLQAELYDAAYADPDLPRGFVSEPESDPAMPPPHLTGGTIDCSLMVDGIALGLGAGFDDFTARAHADALEASPGIDRELRRWLYWTMRAAGFVVLDCEWWHFEFGTRRWAGITGAEPLFGPAAAPTPS
ncbi:MAG: M15 family metallopeptidase [Acidimicrobiales bacterium]